VNAVNVGLLTSIFVSDILPIFVLAAVGFLLARRFGASVKTLSTVAFNSLSPCLVFDQLVTAQISGSQSLRVAAFCVLLTLGIGIAARLTSMPLRLDRTTLSSFLLVAMFSNSGNYALPVVLFAFGKEALAFASVYFVTSAVLIYSAGILVAASGHGSVRTAATRLLRVPAVYAVVAAMIVLATGATVPTVVMRPVKLLSDAAIPVMLLVLGMQLERATAPKHPRAVAAAVVLSLVVAPIIAFGLTAVLGLYGAARQAAIVEASMPAAVITTVLALEFDLDAGFATSVVFFTTLLSPITLVILIAYLQR
jgi:malate permease and related proteins